MDLTPDSQRPPKWGASGGLNLYLVPSEDVKFETLFFESAEKKDFNKFFNSRSAPTKFFPQSLIISTHLSRRETNGFKAAMKACEERSLTTSEFIQNYFSSKYKRSKSVTKGMNKFEFRKEQTGCRLGNAFNNNNNNDNKQ